MPTPNVVYNPGTELRFKETSPGTNYVALKGPGTVASDVTWTLPASDASGALVSDGAGNLSFAGGGAQIVSTWTTAGSAFLTATTATTNHKFVHVTNTGGGFYLGVESSVGSTLIAGGSPYATILSSVGPATPLILGTDDVARLTISSAGDTSLSGAFTLPDTGNFSIGKTIVAPGSTGAQTIHKISGRVNFAAAATSLVVTCNLCTVNSRIFLSKATNDATAVLGAAVAGAGSFTIHMDTGPAAECAVNFLVLN